MPKQSVETGGGLSGKTHRRALLKGAALLVLGASAIIQPAGGVLFGQDPPKKDDLHRGTASATSGTAEMSKDKKGGKSTAHSKKHHKPKITPDEPKKDGGSKITLDTPKKDGGSK